MARGPSASFIITTALYIHTTITAGRYRCLANRLANSRRRCAFKPQPNRKPVSQPAGERSVKISSVFSVLCRRVSSLSRCRCMFAAVLMPWSSLEVECIFTGSSKLPPVGILSNLWRHDPHKKRFEWKDLEGWTKQNSRFLWRVQG